MYSMNVSQCPIPRVARPSSLSAHPNRCIHRHLFCAFPCNRHFLTRSQLLLLFLTILTLTLLPPVLRPAPPTSRHMNFQSPSAPRYHIQLMYGNGGGGHKASALAIQKILQSSPVADCLHVELVDASFIAGATLGDWLYNLLLSYDFVTAIEIIHSALQNLIFPLMRPSLRQAFRTHFSNSPHLHCVVSFVPMLNAIFAESLPSNVPLMTVLTDFSHTSGHPWIQHPRQHVIAGTDIAVAQALSSGFAKDDTPSASMRVTQTSGMVVHPRFYSRMSPATRRRRRVDLGLPPDLPTILLLFGAFPPTDRVLRLVDLFLDLKDEVNVITICAKSRILYDRLTRRKRRDRQRRLFVTGFTTDIPLFMQVSDVLVGKPGPGVVSEAFVSGLPCVLVTGSSESQVMKQERDVLDWVRRHNVGVVAHSEEDAAKITLDQITQMRTRISHMPPNHAVFEVRDLVLQELDLLHDTNEGSTSTMSESEESESDPKKLDFSPVPQKGILHALKSQPIQLDFRKQGLILSSVSKTQPLDGLDEDVDDEDDGVGSVEVA